jgi:hypothetical protein
MRILIIANQRSGSTVLGEWLSYELNYKYINEPDTVEDIIEDNIIVKCLYVAISSKNLNKLFEKYDKIIGLIRKNTDESAISLLYCQENINNYNFHGLYSVDNNWIVDRKEKIKNISNLNRQINFNIKSISGILHCSYESIYQEKNDIELIKNYLNIEKFKYIKMLDLSNRYRNGKNNLKLL